MGPAQFARRLKRGWTAPVQVGSFAYEPMPDEFKRRELPRSARAAVRRTQLHNTWAAVRGQSVDTGARLATVGRQTINRGAVDLVEYSHPLSRERAVAQAKMLVQQRFPDAHAAWLGGSFARGTATSTSDLDILVLLDGPPGPFRESLVDDGMPVELFVQTPESLLHFREEDQQRRQPTTARLVGETILLVDRDGDAVRIADDCVREIAAGPKALSDKESQALRYALTDMREDLVGSTSSAEELVLAAQIWEASARLLLAHERRWQGTGKGLLRELNARDASVATGSEGAGAGLGRRLTEAFEAVGRGDKIPLVDAAGDVLNHCGGSLFEGFTVGKDPEPT